MRNWYFILKDMEYEINILDYRILYVYNLKYRKYKNFMYMYVVLMYMVFCWMKSIIIYIILIINLLVVSLLEY